MERVFLKMMQLDSGDPHRIQHFTKVHSYARWIGLGEGVDDETQRILEIAAIVHDIGIKPAIEKHGSGSGRYQELEGPPVAEEMLKSLGYPQHIIDRVCYLVGHHHTYTGIDGVDYQILVEADFLVNLFEHAMDGDAVQSTLDNIFRTRTGREYCRTMFQVK